MLRANVTLTAPGTVSYFKVYEAFMKKTLYVMMLLGSLFGAAPAHATDGCKVLLCLAGNWSNISQCRPEVEQAMWDASHGRGWPSCNMGGSSAANLQWASEATCPPFYSTYNMDTGQWAGCRYSGVVSVKVNGLPWSDLYWSTSGGPTSTRYYDQARTALGANIDPTYARDAAAYVPPAPPPPCVGGDSC